MAREDDDTPAPGWRTRLACRLLRRERAGRRGCRPLPPEAVSALGGVLGTLPRDEAFALLAGSRPRGEEDPPRPLPPDSAAALHALVAGLPMDQTLGLIAGWTSGASLRAWLPVEPGLGVAAQDPAVTELLAEAWVATTGYAGLLAALVSYLAVRPALDQEAFPTDARLIQNLRRAASGARAVPPPRAAVSRIVTDSVTDPAEGGTLHLLGAELRFPDRAAAWVLLHELVARRSYDFAPDPARAHAPRVLDCGAHHGLGVWAFLRRFPGARITAFEPDPGNRAILEGNARRNRWSGVEVLPFALAAGDGEAAFAFADGRSMAGTLTGRLGTPSGTRTVETRRLSAWLDEPVDFLKLDIEGPEAEVLAEAAGPDGRGLDAVGHLFCEYHHGHGLASDRLPRLLATLDAAGFDVQVGRSFTAELGNAVAPLLDAGKPYALDVHARRADPGDAG